MDIINIMGYVQIRAEEVSQIQYMLEMKFTAQGLDKKVCVCVCVCGGVCGGVCNMKSS